MTEWRKRRRLTWVELHVEGGEKRSCACVITHPGDEISYVLAGEGEILMDGNPPLKVKPGDGFIIPGGTKHDAHNTGTQPLRLVGVYVIEKGKPLATPAP